jgi:DNA-binding NarL/FixJ family response regulator
LSTIERRGRGYISIMRGFYQNDPDILAALTNLERVIANKQAPGTLDAATLASQASIRNPLHFHENHIHLSDFGRLTLYRLYDEGVSVRDAAARLCISKSAAQVHRSNWLRRTQLTTPSTTAQSSD